MGSQIIKQPDGKYAVWSSNVDHFILVNALPAEIIENYLKDERDRITDIVTQKIATIDAGGKPYYQFTKTWDEALQTVAQVHGEEAKTLFLADLWSIEP